jgi:hypothetical protein
MQTPSRRDFIEKAAYVAPVILTLQAAPTIAKAGSVKDPPRDRPKWPPKPPRPPKPKRGRDGDD